MGPSQAIFASSTCFIFLADAESAVEIVAQTIVTASPKYFRMTQPFLGQSICGRAPLANLLASCP
jgi:hypothetical protein